MINEKILHIAARELGVREIKGREDNEEILKYFYEMGLSGKQLKDETAWCSAFINYVAIQSGAENTGALNARSWLKVGTPVFDPKPGDICILWRESRDSWKGHVGIFMEENRHTICLLGGNQSNRVKTSWYPKRRLLGYRRLRQLPPAEQSINQF